MAWSRDEVEAIVGDYFAMLRKELAGEVYSKTRHRARLSPQLNHRSDGSIEFKHADISAVLVGFGLPYIDGYKPRGNYQRLLEEAVLEYLVAQPDFFPPLLHSPVLDPEQLSTAPTEFEAVMEDPPERLDATPRVWTPDRRVVQIDFVRRDAENRRSDGSARSSSSSWSGDGSPTVPGGRTSRARLSGRHSSGGMAPATISPRSRRTAHRGTSK